MLLNRVREIETPDYEPSDLDFFESSLGTIFNDYRDMHGDPGQAVVFMSKFGDVKLRLADPDKSRTSLYSHHLWNAGVLVAIMIENGEIQIRDQDVLELGAGKRGDCSWAPH